MNNSLIMHYPSTKTCYFATGEWCNSSKIKDAHFEIDSTISSIIYHGSATKAKVLAFFQGKLDADDSKIPSIEKVIFWIQAPIADSCVSRLCDITCNSGKFLIFVPFAEDLDSSWFEFKKNYVVGELGYAIQCSSARLSPHDRKTSNGLITIHMEDSFDLEEISKVSYKIFEIIHQIWNLSNECVLQYMTDRTIRAKTKAYNHPEAAMLFTISSKIFIENFLDCNAIPESLENYKQTFDFVGKAQNRQNLLKDKIQKF